MTPSVARVCETAPLTPSPRAVEGVMPVPFDPKASGEDLKHLCWSQCAPGSARPRVHESPRLLPSKLFQSPDALQALKCGLHGVPDPNSSSQSFGNTTKHTRGSRHSSGHSQQGPGQHSPWLRRADSLGAFAEGQFSLHQCEWGDSGRITQETGGNLSSCTSWTSASQGS